MKILVTGAEGQLGRSIIALFATDWQVLAVNRRELDIVDAGAVRAKVAALRPDAIVNCAAYNEVDRAEDEPAAAFAVNATGVRSLARAAADAGAVFVHYSTDFVFDGEADTPYHEGDPPGPRSVYGHSKLAGERHAAEAQRYYVLRLASLFGGGLDPGGRRRGSTLDRIADAMLAGRDVNAFVDRMASPSYVEDVARATSRLLSAGAPHGVYHCVNSGMASWCDMSREAARLLGTTARVVPIRTRDVTVKATRPRFCALSNARLAAAGIPMPPWQDALARYLRQRTAQGSSVGLDV
jgi:dTDP-4-dehydrorhamnose reductase